MGYHTKPDGCFVTLFNAFQPLESSRGRTGDMSSLKGYGESPVKQQQNEKRNAVKRKLDQFTDWLSRGKNEANECVSQTSFSRSLLTRAIARRSISRRYSTPLRTGHKTAHLFTESTRYSYIADPDLVAPRKWFKVYVDHILAIYGTEHSIQKEDLMLGECIVYTSSSTLAHRCLVIGTLDAPEYAMFVSHTHPDGQVNFNVFTGSRVGQKWGEFSTSTDLGMAAPGGPAYKEEVPLTDFYAHVSSVKKPSEAWDTVLIARLRFPPDRDEATIL